MNNSVYFFSSGMKRKSNNGAGRKLKRRKKREANGTQVENYVPTREVIPIPPSSHKVFHHDQRHLFRLPCFYRRKIVLLSDSMSKYLPRRILPDLGFESVSFSGLDILEASLLINYGKVVNSNMDKILDSERKSMGLLKKSLPEHPMCRHCGHQCNRTFKGPLVLNFFLNSSLKSSKKSFNGQSIDILFDILHNTLQMKFPRAKLVFVRPVKPNAYKFKTDPKAVQTFDEIVQKVNSENRVIGDIMFGRDNDAFTGDGIHLDHEHSETYFRRILDNLRNLDNFDQYFRS